MIGRTLGHYSIESKIAQGGMGVVYKARDLHLDRPVAIKVLPPETVADADRKQRFVQEAKTASALNHPNIIHVYDIDSLEGVDFIAMEFVSGKSLAQLVDGKCLPVAEALRYAVQIADALAKAHRAGVVHRDLKLANIMVNDEGLVKVLDFGVAKLMERTSAGDSTPTVSIQTLTLQGGVVGTVAYMSPEQAEAKPVDARSDIFSFGAVLYEMVTGRLPFTGDTMMSTIAAILREDPKRPGHFVAGIPVELERIIARCLRKDPERRFQHAEDLKVALEELQEEVSSRRLGPLRRVYFAGALALSASLAVAAIWMLWRPAPKPMAPVRTVPLTSFAGVEREPSFSPDGNQVAFSWDGSDGNNFDIYVKLIQGGALLRLTSNPAHDGFPAWSPDGRHIAFLRHQGERAVVLLISPLGGPERRVADAGGENVAWSPDGKFLVVCDRDAGGDTSAPPAGPAPGLRRAGAIGGFVVSVATGERRKLTSPAREEAFDTDFAFSPDAKSIAFVRWKRTGSDVYLLPLANGPSGPAAAGDPLRLTSDERYVRGLAWTPDSRHIVFSSNRTGSWSLWRIDAKESSAAAAQLAGVTSDAFHPAILRAGPNGPVRLAYEHSLQDVNIWQMDLTASAAARAPSRLMASTRFDGNPQLSPDSKKLAFTSDRSGFYEIWVSDRDGSNPNQLTTFAATMTASPQWSPDGERIAFDSQSGSNRDIYVTSLDGAPPRRVTSEQSEEARPCWSTDGRWVYFMSTRSGTRQIWKAPSDGGGAVQVTRQGGYECQASPDGKLLYYTKGAGSLWTVPVNGGDETPLIESVLLGCWTAGRKGIYFVEAATGPRAGRPVKLYQYGTGRITQLAVLEGQVDSGRRMLAISPDDRWLLWSRTDLANSDLVLIEDFR